MYKIVFIFFLFIGLLFEVNAQGAFEKIETFEKDFNDLLNELPKNSVNQENVLFLNSFGQLEEDIQKEILSLFKSVLFKKTRLKVNLLKYIYAFNRLYERQLLDKIRDLNSVSLQSITLLKENEVDNYFNGIRNYLRDTLFYTSNVFSIKPDSSQFEIKFFKLKSTEEEADDLPDLANADNIENNDSLNNEENSDDSDGFDNADDGFENTDDSDSFDNTDDGFDNADDSDSFDNTDDGFDNVDDSDSFDNTDDGFDNVDDSDGFDNFEEDSGEAGEEENVFITKEYSQELTEQIPELEGPSIKIMKTDLYIQTQKDTIALREVQGWLLLNKQIAILEGGIMDWETRDLPKDSVYVTLKKYYFDFANNEFDANSILTNKIVLDNEVPGVFQYKVRQKDKKYPKFKSNKSDIIIYLDAEKDVKYTGGFSLEGNKISSESYESSTSLLEVKTDNNRSLKASSNLFDLNDSMVKANQADIKLYFESDSLIHPNRKLIFNTQSKMLKLLKPTTRRYKEAPYENSFFGVNLYGDILLWDMNADSLSLSTILARSQIPAFVESNEYFINQRFNELRGFNRFHPLLITIGYARKINSGYFYIDELYKYMKNKAEPKAIEDSIIFLSNMGFLHYDYNTGYIRILKKAYHYVLSQQKKKDFDNLLIASTTDKNKNIIYRLKDKQLVINGVKEVYLSKLLDVYLATRDNKIVLNQGKNFHFDGVVNAGNFEYFGSEFHFNYNDFNIKMDKIDSIQMYNKVEMPDGTFRREKLNNKISGSSVPNKIDSKEDIISQNEQTGAADKLSTENQGATEEELDAENQDTLEEGQDSENQGATEEELDAENQEETTEKDNEIHKLTTVKGTLYINQPNNKSGRKTYPKYPWFSSEAETFIFFDRKSILNGVYGNRVKFRIPQLKIDSTSRGDLSDINFDGFFSTDDLLPEFKENLVLMPDNSLGFIHEVPSEGYTINSGTGKFYNKLKLNENGLRGDGRIEYLDLDIKSNDFIFYPDSITTQVNSYLEMKPRENSTYPDFNVKQYKMSWKMQNNDLTLRNLKEKFNFYNNTGKFSGEINVKKNSILAIGLFETLGSVTASKDFEFKTESFKAQHTRFKINSENKNKPILDANDVAISFDLVNKNASITPEVEGVAALNFPYAQVKTSIPQAFWDLNENKVSMKKDENSPLNSSYFYSTKKELDSLSFFATYAEYDINALRLNIGGIPFINVADAKITPNEGNLTILENFKIEKLENAKIKLDTLSEYHSLEKGYVSIYSRKKFNGSAIYNYITPFDTLFVKVNNFNLVNYSNKKNREVLHTNGKGNIKESDNFSLTPKFFFKGQFLLEAHKKDFIWDGFVKIDLLNKENFDYWIKYTTNPEDRNVYVNYSDLGKTSGKIIQTGLFFNHEVYELEYKFIEPELVKDTHPLFQTDGQISYDFKNKMFRIENIKKTTGITYDGSIFSYNENTGVLNYEGLFDFTAGFEKIPIYNKASILLSGNMKDNQLNMAAMIGFDFHLGKKAIEVLYNEIIAVTEYAELPLAYKINEKFYHKIGVVEGNKVALNYKKSNEKNHIPYANVAKKLIQSLVFSNINMKRDTNKLSFYSVGKYLALSHLVNYDANLQIEGMFELQYDINFGATFDLSFKLGDFWYYFKFQENQLLIDSSNDDFIDAISSDKKKNKGAYFDIIVDDQGLYDEFTAQFKKDHPKYLSETLKLSDSDSTKLVKKKKKSPNKNEQNKIIDSNLEYNNLEKENTEQEQLLIDEENTPQKEEVSEQELIPIDEENTPQKEEVSEQELIPIDEENTPQKEEVSEQELIPIDEENANQKEENVATDSVIDEEDNKNVERDEVQDAIFENERLKEEKKRLKLEKKRKKAEEKAEKKRLKLEAKRKTKKTSDDEESNIEPSEEEKKKENEDEEDEEEDNLGF